MDDFNNLILDSHLCDIAFIRSNFTWTNSKLWQGLDRVLFNHNWIACFNNSKVEHLSKTLSNNSPLFITFALAD